MKEKLIRHRIPEIAAAKGEVLKTRKATKEETADLLWSKLKEEIGELLDTKSAAEFLQEAVDVHEAILAICLRIGIDHAKFSEAWMKKYQERGGFAAGVVLIQDDDG